MNIGRYSIAVFSTAVVIWFRSMLQPWLNEECPFSLFYLSVLLTAWLAGSGPAVFAIVLGTFAAARFFISPTTNLFVDGVPELVQLTIYVIVNCVAVFLFDRAERQRRLAENRATENVRLGADLQHADRRKDEFLALLAHELRNPLAPIRTSMALLERNEDSPETVRRVREVISRQTQHLIRITDDLLEVSRFCRGHLELVMERIDLRESIRDAIEMIESSFLEKSQRFQFVVPELPLWVQGDRVRLTQLTANLLGNASKYTPSSGSIRVVVDQCDEHVLIAITDTGIGLAADQVDRIFEPFVQVDASRTREYGGLGLGLSIVKRLVDLHDGKLFAESRGPGLGSKFTVELPLDRSSQGLPNTAPDCQPDQAIKAMDTAPSFQPVHFHGDEAETCEVSSPADSVFLQPKLIPVQPDQPRKLLLVDDNLDASRMLCDLFESSGFQVAQAADGIEAINLAQRFRPSIIIMDIGLPGMDGYEVARRLRREPQFAKTSLLALTGWGSKHDRELAKQAGFDLHLVKPVAFADLLATIQNLPVDGGQMADPIH